MDQVTIAGKQLSAKALPLIESERSALREGLGHRDLDAACVALADTYARLERNTRDAIARSGASPACRRGCGWCCHGVKVNVSALEALVIARHLEAGEAKLRAEVLAAADRRRAMSTDQLFISRDRCPFLGAEDECQIHPIRPLACRRHSCMDAGECERAVRFPELKLAVSQHSSVLAVGALAGVALAAALEDARLDYREFELTSAVSVALTPGTAQNWLAGGGAFDGAVRAVDAWDNAVARAEIGTAATTGPQTAPVSPWRSRSKKRKNGR